MSTHWLTRRTQRAARQEGGFTLLEMVISVVLLTLITGAISAAFVTSLNATSATKTRVTETNDAQLIAAFFTRDAQAAGGTNPGTGTPNAALGVTTPGVAGTFANGCTTPGTPIVGFAWTDLSSGAAHESNYSYITATTVVGTVTYQPQELLRTVCSTTAPTPATSILANNIITTTTGSLLAPFAYCDNNAPPAVNPCPVLIPNTVQMTISDFTNTPSNPTTPYTFTLTASIRPQANAAPTVTPTVTAPLILLGSGGSCSNGATGLNIVNSSNLTVYGQTYINATNGGSCNAMNLQGGILGFLFPSNYYAVTTSILSPGTCAQDSFTNGCPPPNPFSTPFADPYSGLTPPNPASLPTNASTSCNGNLASGNFTAGGGLNIFGSATCTLTGGVYYLQHGLTLAAGAKLVTAPGAHVLIYVAGGTFNALFGTSIAITGLAAGVSYPSLAAGQQYAGLAIWQAKSDSNPITFGANFTGNVTVNGVIYAPGASVTNTFSIGQSLNATGIVSQTLVTSNGGTTVIGPTPSALTVAAATLPNATQGQAYSAAMSATGGLGAYTWSASGLPSGLNINSSTGVISGAPTVNSSGGTLNFTVTATDGVNETDSQTFSLAIISAPTVSTVSPNPRSQGWSGNVTISGTNFYAGATVSFSGVGITVIGTPTVNGAGTQITANLNILGTAGLGGHGVTVTNTDGGTTTPLNTLTVSPAPTATGLSPTSGPVGTTGVTISVANLIGNHALTVTVGGTSATITAGGTTNAAGSSTVTFTIPAVPHGPQTVSVSDGTNTAVSATSFTVNSSATGLNPTSGGVGSSASITAQGFSASHGLTVTVGGTSATITAGATTGTNGSATVTFTIPALTTGAKTVIVSDGTNSATSATNFTVTAPAVTAVDLSNGGQNARADGGDTEAVNFSTTLNAANLCSTWTNGATRTLNNATVTFANVGTNDTFSVTSTSCAGNGNFGTFVTGGDYVSGTLTFTNSTVTWNPTNDTLTVTLGTVGSTTNRKSFVTAGKPGYTPGSGVTDLGGNALPATNFTSGITSGF